MRLSFKYSFLIFSIVFSISAKANQDYRFDLLNTPDMKKDNPTWTDFQKFIADQTEAEKYKGVAYLVSGGLVTIGSQVGYANSKDPFAKI